MDGGKMMYRFVKDCSWAFLGGAALGLLVSAVSVIF